MSHPWEAQLLAGSFSTPRDEKYHRIFPDLRLPSLVVISIYNSDITKSVRFLFDGSHTEIGYV